MHVCKRTTEQSALCDRIAELEPITIDLYCAEQTLRLVIKDPTDRPVTGTGTGTGAGTGRGTALVRYQVQQYQ